jgi:hypothetical protein
VKSPPRNRLSRKPTHPSKSCHCDPSRSCHPERSEGSAVVFRRAAVITMCLVICAPALARPDEHANDWQSFTHLCGCLEYMWVVPEGRKNKILVEHRKPLPQTRLELFQWQEGASCCSDLTLVETVITKRDGSFDFTNSSPGKYFLVAHWKGTHSSEIEITSNSDKHDDCGAQGLGIDESGKLTKVLIIRLD